MTSTVLGTMISSNDVGRFCLLDIDASCVPSNAHGILRHGTSYFSKMLPINEHRDELANWALIDSDDGDGFSIHIESDWDYDTQTSVMAYRHQGRLVQCLSPELIDRAFGLMSSQGEYHQKSPARGSNTKTNTDELSRPLRPISYYHNRRGPLPGRQDL